MATIQEIQRLSCVAPASLIHSTTRDVEVEGYKLRKGQPFVANLTKFMHDSNVFEDPKHFKPQRFIENDGHAVSSAEQCSWHAAHGAHIYIQFRTVQFSLI